MEGPSAERAGPFDILRTKLTPPRIGLPLLARPRLIVAVREALQKKLLVLSAEAGYGKTSLLLSALPQLAVPVAWLTLDESDSDPNLLTADLVAAIQVVVPTFGEDVLQTLTTGPSPDILRQRLLLALEDSPPVAVVMDDFHVLDNSAETLHMLDVLLLALPPAVHLIVASRTWPQMRSLPRLLVAGQASVVDKTALGFTAEEAAAFLRDSHGLTVSDVQVEQLAGRTEGWPAALQLVALASKARGAVAVEGTSREIFEYLATTVLNALTPTTQAFLLRTSILSELWPSLCRAVVDHKDPAALLQELERQNLFLVRLDEAGTRYRYHQLFAEFLRQQLAQRGGEPVTGLHRQAGRQLEEEGIPEQAVRHYIAAEAYEDAERVMKPLHGDRLTAKLAYVFRDIVTRLPVRLQEQYPWITRSGASACRFVGDYERALVFARRAMQAAEGKDPTLWAFGIHGIGVMYSYMDRYEDAIAICRPALTQMDERVEPRMRASVLAVLADCYLQLGDLNAAQELSPRLQDLTTEMARPGKGTTPAFLTGNIAAARLEYRRAADHYRDSLQQAVERGSLTYQVFVLTALVRVQLAAADLTAALESLRRAHELHQQTGERGTDLALTHLQGDAHLLRGDAETAARFYQQTLDKCREGESQEPRAWALIGLARVARAKGHYAEAESLLLAAAQLCQRTTLGKVVPHITMEHIGLMKVTHRPEAGLRMLPGLRDVFTRWNSSPGLAICALFEAGLEWDRGGAQRLPDAGREALADGLRLASGCLDDVIPFVEAEAAWSVRLLIDALRRGVQADVAERLLALVGGAAVEPLIAALREPALKGRAAVLLGQIGDPRARRPLARLLLSGRDPQVQQAAEQALAVLREPEPARLDIRMLGKFEVTRDGAAIDDRTWKTQKVKTLCKYLVLLKGRPVHREQLIELLWPDVDPRAGAVNFKTAVKHLRQTLEPLLEGTRSHFIQRSGETFQFVVGPSSRIDLDEYDQLLADADRSERAGELAHALTVLERAAALYRGDLLEEDRYADWTAIERERRRETHIQVLERLAHLYEQRRDYRRAIDAMHTVLSLDRLRETAYQNVIRYHLLRGDRQAAVQAYQACERLLREEMGVAPQPETAAVLQQTPTPA